MTVKAGSNEQMSHYVYIYRDQRRKPRYVGYGKAGTRATSHLSHSHNDALNIFLDSGNYTLEIAGPFESEIMARCVETALISALQPDCNRDLGHAGHRFRPLSVPESFADRLILPPLMKTDFLQLRDKRKLSFLFVRIGDRNFDDGRMGFDPANPLSDVQLLQRMDRWWQLGRHIIKWRDNLDTSPSVLIGVNGKPGAQVIIGAALINPSGWDNVETEGGLYAVPTLETPTLDAFNLRGRRISREANLKFGAFYSQIFLILNADGTVEGGNP